MTKLRLIGPDEFGKPEPVLSVVEAAAHGSTRQLLVAMRDRVAEAVQNPDTAARDLSSLTIRLRALTRDIEAIDAKEAEDSASAESTVDDEWKAI